MKEKLLVIVLICLALSLSGCTGISSIHIPLPWGGQKPTPQPSESLNAIVSGDTIPAVMAPGKAYTVSITIRNTGSQSWSSSDRILLGPADDPANDAILFNNSTFSISPGDMVKTGSDYNWNISMTVPPWIGNYTIKYRMMSNGTYFGKTFTRNVTVGDLNATAVYVTKGDTIYPAFANMKIKKGAWQNVSITVKNMGRYDWTADQVSLGVVDYEPNNATLFNPTLTNYLAPEGVVRPGDQCTWKFKLHAPVNTGTFRLEYRMKQGDQWFGKPISANITVT